MDHSEERKANEEAWTKSQQEVVDIIKELLEEDIDDEEIHRLMGILQINSLHFSSSRDGVTGQALYPLLSLVNHSCLANSRFAGATCV